MSTYSFLAGVLSLNLTYHVEHHDFPSVHGRLPAVRRAAPEFYSSIRSSRLCDHRTLARARRSCHLCLH